MPHDDKSPALQPLYREIDALRAEVHELRALVTGVAVATTATLSGPSDPDAPPAAAAVLVPTPPPAGPAKAKAVLPKVVGAP